MKIISIQIVVLLCLVFSSRAVSSSDEKSLKDLRIALENISQSRKISNNVSFVEYFRLERELAGAFTQTVNQVFSDSQYDHHSSFFTLLLQSPDVSEQITSQICIMRSQKSQSGTEHSRLCNFMIQTLYKCRTINTNACEAIKSVLYFNDYPEVYSPVTREIVKKLILEKRIHFFYADVAGIIKDKEIQAYLLPIANQEGRYKESGYYQTWLATCMLAKAGDKVAHKRVEDEADSLSDLHKAMYIPLGMAYIGDREMVLRLFKMLKSDLKRWNGEDVDPEETQLSHESAAVLSLSVRDFPKISTFQKYTATDKAKCLKWAEDNKNTFVLENKPPLYYLKNTRIGFLTQ